MKTKKQQTYTNKQMEELQMKITEGFSDIIRNKYILISDYKNNIKRIKSKKKKEFNLLLKAIQDLNKTIKKLKSQEVFLLDEREASLKKQNLKLENIIKEIEGWKIKKE